jgi:hypothetical protein
VGGAGVKFYRRGIVGDGCFVFGGTIDVVQVSEDGVEESGEETTDCGTSCVAFACSSQAFEGYRVTTNTAKERIGDLLTLLILTILYIPISKVAIDSLTWNDSLSPGNACYHTSSEGFNWVILHRPRLIAGDLYPPKRLLYSPLLYADLALPPLPHGPRIPPNRRPIQRGRGTSHRRRRRIQPPHERRSIILQLSL